MVLAVPPDRLSELTTLCDLFDVEWSDIGAFTGQGRLVVCYRGQVVLDLENDFLHDGIPQRHLLAHIPSLPHPNHLPKGEGVTPALPLRGRAGVREKELAVSCFIPPPQPPLQPKHRQQSRCHPHL